jgi:aminoglycoside N3'-acetyltransferase
MPMTATCADLLAALDVTPGAVTYVHSSHDWIERAGVSGSDVLRTLQARAGRATVVMPAYPSRVTHVEYLQTLPVFDVQRTPAAVGLLAEAFRRTAGAVRSADPDFSIVALGPDAGRLTVTDPEEHDPFGPRSVYRRLIDEDALLVGLGVSLNTNSFIHVIDSALETMYPWPVYEPAPLTATVVGADGTHRVVRRRALRPMFQTSTRPAAIAEALADDAATFRRVTLNNAIFFRWHLKRWERWCLEHARRELAAGRPPCWLAHVA